MSRSFNISIDKLVHDDVRNAEVLNVFQIDFCCRANRSLESACREKGVDTRLVIEEINQIQDSSEYTLQGSIKWPLDLLIEYILVYHHFYLWQELPKIEKLLDTLVKIHAAQYPLLVDLAKYFASLKFESELHMGNEEQTLFPYICELLMAQASSGQLPLNSSNGLDTTISVMRMEHEATVNILQNIRHLCHDYDLTKAICNSHRLALKKLKDLEKDLYQHIHLENHVLFPKALKLEKGIISK